MAELEKSGFIVEQRLKLKRAYAVTSQLLFGNLAEIAVRVVIQPDLKQLKPRLVQLSTTLDFDCVELAKILVGEKKRRSPISKMKDQTVASAADWLFSTAKRLPLELARGDPRPIYASTDAGDVRFFIKLGEHLDNRIRHKKVRLLDELTFLLKVWWAPSEVWPGLAYFKNSARMDFCGILLPGNIPDKKNLDQAWRRLGLITARHPFISEIRAKDRVLMFS